MNFQTKNNHYWEITDKKIIEILMEAMITEEKHIDYYTKLIKMTNVGEEKNIMKSILADEIKHRKLLGSIYESILGKQGVTSPVDSYVGGDFSRACSTGALDKFESVELYKGLYLMVRPSGVRDVLFDILMDEQSHINKLLYISR